MNTYYKCLVTKHIEKDIFNEGCQPETFQDFGVIDSKQSSTIETLIKLLKNDYKNIIIDDGFFMSQKTENADGYEASGSQVSEWKKGNVELWSATYNFYVTKITEEETCMESIKGLVQS